MFSDEISLVLTLQAAGATTRSCLETLLQMGLGIPEALCAMHEAMRDSCATVRLAAHVLIGAQMPEDTRALGSLAETLKMCGIHPFSVECAVLDPAHHGWWRDHPDFPSGRILPHRTSKNESLSRSEIQDVDLSSLERLELVIPDEIILRNCRLPDRFVGGISTKNLTLINCPGLRDLEGVRFLPCEHDLPMEDNQEAITAPSLHLEGLPDLEQLPQDVQAYWNLTLKTCPKLRPQLPTRVFKILNLGNLEWEEAPEGSDIDINLGAIDGETQDLPAGACQMEDLELSELPWKRLPPNLSFSNLLIQECPQLRLPKGLTVPGYLRLTKGTLETLPADLKVARWCYIGDCTGMALPPGLCTIQLNLQRLQELESLPKDMKVDSLLVEACPHLFIPKKLAGRLKGRIAVRP